MNQSLSQRMHALQKRQLREDGTRGGTTRTTGAVMAEKLELAAIYASDGATLTAAPIALLALFGIDETAAARYAVVRGIDGIHQAVLDAIERHGSEVA